MYYYRIYKSLLSKCKPTTLQKNADISAFSLERVNWLKIAIKKMDNFFIATGCNYSTVAPRCTTAQKLASRNLNSCHSCSNNNKLKLSNTKKESRYVRITFVVLRVKRMESMDCEKEGSR
jgi:hypothetical protein